tara:strand:- start:15772 stop:16002 length:231 start_codon:yes stop_codon:yes gene_type:complete
MKVKDLILKLQNLEDPDAEVILSSDPEGNGYLPLQCVEEGTFTLEDYEPSVREENYAPLQADPEDLELVRGVYLYP